MLFFSSKCIVFFTVSILVSIDPFLSLLPPYRSIFSRFFSFSFHSLSRSSEMLKHWRVLRTNRPTKDKGPVVFSPCCVISRNIGTASSADARYFTRMYTAETTIYLLYSRHFSLFARIKLDVHRPILQTIFSILHNFSFLE